MGEMEGKEEGRKGREMGWRDALTSVTPVTPHVSI